MTSIKKFKVWIRTDLAPNGRLTFYCNDLLKFCDWSDKNLPGWKFFNVYDRKADRYLTSFTQKLRPRTRHDINGFNYMNAN